MRERIGEQRRVPPLQRPFPAGNFAQPPGVVSEPAHTLGIGVALGEVDD